MLAAKSEEQDANQPRMEDYEWVTSNSCKERDLARMEKRICCDLKWQFCFKSNPLLFLAYLKRCSKVNDEIHAYAVFLCDLAILDYYTASTKPLTLATTALLLAEAIYNRVVLKQQTNGVTTRREAYIRKVADVPEKDIKKCTSILQKVAEKFYSKECDIF